MKINIEFDTTLTENEITIRCASIDSEVQKIQEALSSILASARRFICYQGETEYYLPIEEILFFETGDGGMWAHTKNQVYQTKMKLYELEETLPGCFMRVSKSTILNTTHIFSITRNLTASSVVEFNGTHKQVYVSRHYYKPLKIKLEEKRKDYEK